MAGGSLTDECCPEELAALVEHALFDYVIRPPQHRLRNRQPEVPMRRIGLAVAIAISLFAAPIAAQDRKSVV